jgi:hypothetical protein
LNCQKRCGKQIRQATLKFLSFTEVEKVARPVAEARARVVRIKKAAIELQKVLFDNPQDDGWDARSHADYLINRYSKDLKHHEVIRSCVTLTGSLIVGCNHALKHLKENPGRKKGEAWDNWVCRISEIAKANQLPEGVSKIDDPEKQSPFVALIRQLQTFIPKDLRRSTHSVPALAVTISRARKGHKKPTTRPL